MRVKKLPGKRIPPAPREIRCFIDAVLLVAAEEANNSEALSSPKLTGSHFEISKSTFSNSSPHADRSSDSTKNIYTDCALGVQANRETGNHKFEKFNEILAIPCEKRNYMGHLEWNFPKSDLFHWVPLLDLFDSLQAEIISAYWDPSTRMQSQSSEASQISIESTAKLYTQSLPPMMEKLLIYILTFTRLLLENCSSRNIFSSYDRLRSLLVTDSLPVLCAVLELLLIPARKLDSQSSLRATFDRELGTDVLAILAQLSLPFIPEMGEAEEARFALAFRDHHARRIENLWIGSTEIVSQIHYIKMLSTAIFLLAQPEGGVDSAFFSISPTLITDTVRILSQYTIFSAMTCSISDIRPKSGSSSIPELNNFSTSEIAPPSCDIIADASLSNEKSLLNQAESNSEIEKSRLQRLIIEERMRVAALSILRACFKATGRWNEIIHALSLSSPQGPIAVIFHNIVDAILADCSIVSSPKYPSSVVSENIGAAFNLSTENQMRSPLLSYHTDSSSLKTISSPVKHMGINFPYSPMLIFAFLDLVSHMAVHVEMDDCLVTAGFVGDAVRLLPALEAAPVHYKILEKTLYILDALVHHYPTAIDLFFSLGGLNTLVRQVSLIITNFLSYSETIKATQESSATLNSGAIDFSSDSAVSSIKEEDENEPQSLTSKHLMLLQCSLRFLDKLLSTNGADDRLRNLLETSLFQSIEKIFSCSMPISSNSQLMGSSSTLVLSSENLFKKSYEFSAETISHAVSIVASYIHNEPTSLSILQESNVPQALIRRLKVGIPPTAELLVKLPYAFSAVCLNASGEALFAQVDPVRTLCDLFLQPEMLRPLRSRSTASALGTAMDEFIRHHPSHRPTVIRNIVQTLNSMPSVIQALRSVASESFKTATTASDDLGKESTYFFGCDLHIGINTYETHLASTTNPEESKRRTEPILSQILETFCSFIEGVLQSPAHTKDFVEAGGVSALLGVIFSPGVAFDFSVCNESISISHLLRVITDIDAYAVFIAILDALYGSCYPFKTDENFSSNSKSESQHEKTMEKLIGNGKTMQIDSMLDEKSKCIEINFDEIVKESLRVSNLLPPRLEENLFESNKLFSSLSSTLAGLGLLKDLYVTQSYAFHRVGPALIRAFAEHREKMLSSLEKLFLVCSQALVSTVSRLPPHLTKFVLWMARMQLKGPVYSSFLSAMIAIDPSIRNLNTSLSESEINKYLIKNQPISINNTADRLDWSLCSVQSTLQSLFVLHRIVSMVPLVIGGLSRVISTRSSISDPELCATLSTIIASQTAQTIKYSIELACAVSATDSLSVKTTDESECNTENELILAYYSRALSTIIQNLPQILFEDGMFVSSGSSSGNVHRGNVGSIHPVVAVAFVRSGGANNLTLAIQGLVQLCLRHLSTCSPPVLSSSTFEKSSTNGPTVPHHAIEAIKDVVVTFSHITCPNIKEVDSNGSLALNTLRNMIALFCHEFLKLPLIFRQALGSHVLSRVLVSFSNLIVLSRSLNATLKSEKLSDSETRPTQTTLSIETNSTESEIQILNKSLDNSKEIDITLQVSNQIDQIQGLLGFEKIVLEDFPKTATEFLLCCPDIAVDVANTIKNFIGSSDDDLRSAKFPVTYSFNAVGWILASEGYVTQLSLAVRLRLLSAVLNTRAKVQIICSVWPIVEETLELLVSLVNVSSNLAAAESCISGPLDMHENLKPPGITSNTAQLLACGLFITAQAIFMTDTPIQLAFGSSEIVQVSDKVVYSAYQLATIALRSPEVDIDCKLSAMYALCSITRLPWTRLEKFLRIQELVPLVIKESVLAVSTNDRRYRTLPQLANITLRHLIETKDYLRLLMRDALIKPVVSSSIYNGKPSPAIFLSQPEVSALLARSWEAFEAEASENIISFGWRLPSSNTENSGPPNDMLSSLLFRGAPILNNPNTDSGVDIAETSATGTSSILKNINDDENLMNLNPDNLNKEIPNLLFHVSTSTVMRKHVERLLLTPDLSVAESSPLKQEGDTSETDILIKKEDLMPPEPKAAPSFAELADPSTSPNAVIIMESLTDFLFEQLSKDSSFASTCSAEANEQDERDPIKIKAHLCRCLTISMIVELTHSYPVCRAALLQSNFSPLESTNLGDRKIIHDIIAKVSSDKDPNQISSRMIRYILAILLDRMTPCGELGGTLGSRVFVNEAMWVSTLLDELCHVQFEDSLKTTRIVAEALVDSLRRFLSRSEEISTNVNVTTTGDSTFHSHTPIKSNDQRQQPSLNAYSEISNAWCLVMTVYVLLNSKGGTGNNSSSNLLPAQTNIVAHCLECGLVGVLTRLMRAIDGRAPMAAVLSAKIVSCLEVLGRIGSKPALRLSNLNNPLLLSNSTAAGVIGADYVENAMMDFEMNDHFMFDDNGLSATSSDLDAMEDDDGDSDDDDSDSDSDDQEMIEDMMVLDTESDLSESDESEDLDTVSVDEDDIEDDFEEYNQVMVVPPRLGSALSTGGNLDFDSHQQPHHLEAIHQGIAMDDGFSSASNEFDEYDEFDEFDEEDDEDDEGMFSNDDYDDEAMMLINPSQHMSSVNHGNQNARFHNFPSIIIDNHPNQHNRGNTTRDFNQHITYSAGTNASGTRLRMGTVNPLTANGSSLIHNYGTSSYAAQARHLVDSIDGANNQHPLISHAPVTATSMAPALTAGPTSTLTSNAPQQALTIGLNSAIACSNNNSQSRTINEQTLFAENRDIFYAPMICQTPRRWGQERNLFLGSGSNTLSSESSGDGMTMVNVYCSRFESIFRPRALALFEKLADHLQKVSSLNRKRNVVAQTTVLSEQPTEEISEESQPLSYTDRGPDRDFLLAIPWEMRSEVLEQYFEDRRRNITSMTMSTQTNESGTVSNNTLGTRSTENVIVIIDPEFLASLPSDLAEIYQSMSDADVQRHRRRRRLANLNSNNLTGSRSARPVEVVEEFLAGLSDELQQGAFAVHRNSSDLADPRMHITRLVSAFEESLRRRLTTTDSNGETVNNTLAAPNITSEPTIPNAIADSGTSIRYQLAVSLPSKFAAAFEPNNIASILRVYYDPLMTEHRTHMRLFQHICSNQGTRICLINMLIYVLDCLPDNLGDLDSVLSTFCTGKYGSVSGTSLLKKPLSKKTKTPIGTTPFGGSTLVIIQQRTLQLLNSLVQHNESVRKHFTAPSEAPWTISIRNNNSQDGKKSSSQANSVAQKISTRYPLVVLFACLERSAFVNVPLLVEHLLHLMQLVLASPSNESIATSHNQSQNLTNSEAFSGSSNANPVAPLNNSTNAQSTPPLEIPQVFLVTLVRNLLSANEPTSKALNYALHVCSSLCHLDSVASLFLLELTEGACRLATKTVHEFSTSESLIGRLPSSTYQSRLARALHLLSHVLIQTSSVNRVTPGVGALNRRSNLFEEDRLAKVPENVDLDRLKLLLERPSWQELFERLNHILFTFEETTRSSSAAQSESSNQTTIASSLLPSIKVVFWVERLRKILSSSSSLDALQTAESSPITSHQDHEKLLLFVEKHKLIINTLIRLDPSLLFQQGPFSVLAAIAMKSSRSILDFDNKRAYFRHLLMVSRKSSQQSRPTIAVHVRRAHVFEDSFHAIIGRSGEEIQNGRLSVKFSGEEGMDAGGLTREWFSVLSRQMFDPNYALFKLSAVDKTTYQPNRASWINPDHMLYFTFVGRIIAKAISDNRLLDCYFTRSFYKHMLGQPVDLGDLQSIDPEFHKSLLWILENDITDVIDLTFSVEDEEFGSFKIIDLKPDGRSIPVNENNKREYVRLVTEYKLSTAIKPQIDAFLRGFNEVLPLSYVSIFNESELELLISGLPEIDIDEWRNNTEYTGYTVASPQIQWFWRAVRSFDQEYRAKLFQFVTGTSKVPLEGMSKLQGSSGIQRFQIHRDYGPRHRLPSAHTCFNQLDLPEYESFENLKDLLIKAICECSTGFGLV